MQWRVAGRVWVLLELLLEHLEQAPKEGFTEESADRRRSCSLLLQLTVAQKTQQTQALVVSAHDDIRLEKCFSGKQARNEPKSKRAQCPLSHPNHHLSQPALVTINC